MTGFDLGWAQKMSCFSGLVAVTRLSRDTPFFSFFFACPLFPVFLQKYLSSYFKSIATPPIVAHGQSITDCNQAVAQTDSLS
jgi:hypothetical protein